MSKANLRIVILVTGLITALVHGAVLSLQLGEPSVLFILNGLGYLILIAALFGLPRSLLQRELRMARPGTTVEVALHYLLIGFAGLTIVAWIPNGMRSFTGFATKLDELILIYALFGHLRRVQEGGPARTPSP